MATVKNRKSAKNTKTGKKVVKKQVKKNIMADVPTRLSSTKKDITKVNNQKKNPQNKIVIPIIAVVCVVVLAIVLALNMTKDKKRTVKEVENIGELVSSLDVKMKEPEGAKSINYGIENNDIARMDYEKEVSDGTMMKFTLKSASATEEDITGLKNTWGTKILMTVICADDSDIEVISYVATDNPKIMKSEWYDNDLYYSMTTDNLVTREDFLQEVNRVIIDNHIEFD